MKTIESINDKYVSLVKDMDRVQVTEKELSSLQHAKMNSVEKLEKGINYVSRLVESVKSLLPKHMHDVLSLGKLYIECETAIDEYKESLLANSNKVRILNAAEKVASAQSRFSFEQYSFQEKYGFLLDSPQRILDCTIEIVKFALGSLLEQTKEQKNLAIEFLNGRESIELRETDSLKSNDSLPDKMLVARVPLEKTSIPVLIAVGAANDYSEVYANLRNQGNTIIQLTHEQMGDEAVDDFVLSYIFRFIESFPVGNVNVLLFDQNTGYLYKRLKNAFQSGNVGEVTKRTVQIRDDLRELSDLLNVTCDDIFKKTSIETPDLYSIYENDQTDPFTLVILKDGLVGSDGSVYAEVLETIFSLSKPGNLGHRCGVRLLILDNSQSFEKNLSSNVKNSIGKIRQNCELRFTYLEGAYFLGEQAVEVLHIDGDRDRYVQRRAQTLADRINNKEKNYVSLEDVSADSVTEALGAIMSIPVGKTGNSSVELPFSCKDENGTVAGQCIGYMAIGQSGSGKSSFFHSLVLNGCLKYSPKDLQFWLLDFKNGGASSKYRNSGLPHIKMVAENNRIDDALCLFQMVLEEMERRNKVFNANGTDNIIDYNEIAKANDFEYFPRIIIAIDEVQEIFRDDNASIIQKQISSISSRMRSAGMHFVMVAQNLSDGKSYMLKDAFLPSATGRICFRVAQDIPRDSGFEMDFVQRKQEISVLKTGEAYVSYGKDTIKKVKMAYTSPQDMSAKYFSDIHSKYPEFKNQKPLVIGSKTRISIASNIQGSKNSYADVMRSIKTENGASYAIIGEDAYRMTPLLVRFSQNENSALLLLGSDKQISSSLCASIALSVIRQSVKVHLFNGDRTKVQEGGNTYSHAFMYLCQGVGERNGLVRNHRMNEFASVMSELYAEFLSRQAKVQEADDEDPVFDPVFLIVNDLFAIESFSSNSIVEGGSETRESIPMEDSSFSFDYNIFDNLNTGLKRDGRFKENIQTIVATLVKNGWRYNIHVVLAIKGDPSVWRSTRIVSEVNNAALFNITDYAEQFDNSYYLKEMLKNISNDNEAETMAVWSSHRVYSKIRPFIYKLSNEQERSLVDGLLGEVMQ